MSKPDFSELDHYVSVWGLATIEERIARRATSTIEEMQEFHNALVQRLNEIIKFLNQFPLDEIPTEYLPLKYTVLSLLQVDRPVNKWKKVLLDEACDPRLFQMKTSFYDSGQPES